MDGYAIVTGGARGIGKAISLQLAKKGYNVVINDIIKENTPEAKAILEEIEEKYRVKGIWVQGDISKYDECKKIVAQGIDAFGEKLAILINNAAIAQYKSFLEITPDEYTHLINVNLMGAMHCTHASLPYMSKLGYGSIVNISSIAALSPVAKQIDYSAAKAGIIGMTGAMAREFARYGIRVNSVAPGVILTDMVKNNKAGLEIAIKKTPLRKIGSPEDIAECVAYIIDAEFLTGQTISPNGGIFI